VSGGEKFPAAVAREAIRRHLGWRLYNVARLWQVAGSLRRGREYVSDIDFVVLPIDSGAWEVARTEFPGLMVRGNKVIAGSVPVDEDSGSGGPRNIRYELYRATEANWGMILLVRTGSAEHNVGLAQVAKLRGLSFRAGVGVVDGRGIVVGGETEESIFSALRLPYVEPARRELRKGGPFGAR